MTLTVGSLFSGIGGLDLGLERAGMNVIWQSEIDPYACRVLQKHWPKVTNYGNIKSIQWDTTPRPDVICGGYPCQPFSTAGKRKGTDDPRHLWPWVRDAIGELRPRYAILENVRGHLSMGGLTVIGELAALGYCAEWTLVSAASVGANHRRDRIIIVAYPDGERSSLSEINASESGFAALRQPANGGSLVANGEPIDRPATHRRTVLLGERHNVNHLPAWWEIEPVVDRVADGVPHRVDRIRGLGNAVVPQVAEVIGRLVIQHHNTTA